MTTRSAREAATAVIDLLVVGASPAGLSLADAAVRSSPDRRVIVLEEAPPRCWLTRRLDADEPGSTAVVCTPDTVELEVDATVRHGERIVEIRVRTDGRAEVVTEGSCYVARRVVLAVPLVGAPVTPDHPLPGGLHPRIHLSPPDGPLAGDVLVVGDGDRAVGTVLALDEAPDHVVLASPSGLGVLGPTTRRAVDALVDSGRLTVFDAVTTTAIVETDDRPLVRFSDPSIPELVFDHVVYALGTATPGDLLGRLGIRLGRDLDAPPQVPLLLLGDIRAQHPQELLPVAPTIADALAWIDGPTLEAVAHVAGDAIDELRRAHYNATVTWIEPVHEGLWRFRVEPDEAPRGLVPGRYLTLGLGMWEPRVDGLAESMTDTRRRTLVRRAYSVSSPIVGDDGGPIAPEDEPLEFYVTLVGPGDRTDHLPAFTPRLFRLRPGDRIFCGTKAAGRYTLDVLPPDADVLFLGSGTGEAPHNRMLAELLRRGHRGRIAVVTTMRHARDAGYREAHERATAAFGRYRYLAHTTRDRPPGVPKTYLQDLVRDGTIAERTGVPLDPVATHVFCCGNPTMIGAPRWEDEVPRFDDGTSLAATLHARGFTFDRRGAPGTVHIETYW